MCLAPASVGACSTVDGSDVTVVRQVIQAGDCGYALDADVRKVSKKGFRVRLKITNAAGGKLQSTGFTVLVNAGAASS